MADRNAAAEVPAVQSAQSLQDPPLQSLAIQAAQVGEAELTNGLSAWEARLHPEDRERVTQGLRLYLANPGPFYEAAYRLRHKDTTYRCMLLRAEVIRDSQSRPCRILGYQLDISEQRNAAEDQARLAAIVESSEDAIISKSLEGIVTSWNEGALHLFGYSAEKMLGQPVCGYVALAARKTSILRF